MSSRLIDVIVELASAARVCTIIDQYEQGLILTAGRPRRREPVLTPGLHWHLPFLETVLTQNVVSATEALAAQTVTTADDIEVSFSLMVKWRVGDLRTFLLDVEDADSVLEDVIAGLVADMICGNTWEFARTDEFWRKALTSARRDCKKCGIVLEALKFRDLARVKTIRLIGDD